MRLSPRVDTDLKADIKGATPQKHPNPMADTRILRIRRTDNTSGHLLLNVHRPIGAKPLDLKLVATEHEHLYHGAVKTAGVNSLQASTYRGDISEWSDILSVVLLQRQPDHAATEIARGEAFVGLETVAAISGQQCTITIRKNIGGITQRLGSIKLNQDDQREEISAFDWVESAVAASDDLRSQLDGLQLSMRAQQDQVAKLSRQLESLVQAKKDHEEQLLLKFAALLNTKKLKIRDQQRELMTRRVNAESGTSISHKASAFARGKRKAVGSTPEEEGEPTAADDDAADDDLDMEEGEAQRTPKQEETEDEPSDDDDGFAPPPPKIRSKTQDRQKMSQRSKPSRDPMDVFDGMNELPPKRKLPFGRKAPAPLGTPKIPGVAAPSTVAAGGDDSEEDETDDEL